MLWHKVKSLDNTNPMQMNISLIQATRVALLQIMSQEAVQFCWAFTFFFNWWVIFINVFLLRLKLRCKMKAMQEHQTLRFHKWPLKAGSKASQTPLTSTLKWLTKSMYKCLKSWQGLMFVILQSTATLTTHTWHNHTELQKWRVMKSLFIFTKRQWNHQLLNTKLKEAGRIES